MPKHRHNIAKQPRPRQAALRRVRAFAPARHPFAMLGLALGCLAGTATPPAFGQQPALAAAEVARSFSIPPGTLDQALNRLAAAAGVELAVDAALTRGKTSTGLSGAYTVPEAFGKLLRGHGLQAVRGTGGAWSLRAMPAPNQTSSTTSPAPNSTNDTMLPVVRVKADALRESATAPVTGYVAARSSSGSKTDSATREIPQAISVVTRDSLDERGVSSLAESLEYAPGFTALAYGHDDRYDWSIARGIGETVGSNFRDGLKEAGSVYAIPKLNPYGAERVEFLRGPASVLFGSNIPGGAVNFITKRPTRESQHEFRVRGGDLNRLGVATDLSGPVDQSGQLLYRLVASQERYDLPTPGATKSERYFAPALTLRPGNDTEITLLASYQQDRIDGDAYPYSYYEPLGNAYIPVVEKGWDRFNRDQWSAGVLVDHRISANLALHSRTRYSRARLDYRINFANDLLDNGLVERAAQHIKDDGKVWQTDNYLEAKWSLGQWKNTTIAGLDLSLVRGAEFLGYGIASPYDPATGQGVGSFVPPTPAPTYVADTRQTGLYVQNQAKLDERFVLLVGGRQDWHRIDNKTDPTATTREKSDAFTGRIGGVWLLPLGISPYVSYSTSFQPQGGVNYAGERFKPTTGRQYEVGLRYEPVGVNAQLSAAVFDILRQNVPTTDPDHRDFSVQRGEIGSRGPSSKPARACPKAST